jgi:hypothetical protein
LFSGPFLILRRATTGVILSLFNFIIPLLGSRENVVEERILQLRRFRS